MWGCKLQTNTEDVPQTVYNFLSLLTDFHAICIYLHFKNCCTVSNSIKENSEWLRVCILFFHLRNFKNRKTSQKHSLKIDLYAANAVPASDATEEGQQLSTHCARVEDKRFQF